jgi:gamma-glutamyltranspeptidase/glutathione hydrolase
MSRSFLALSLAAVLAAAFAPTAPAREGSKFHPEVRSPEGVVATESVIAARVGRSILENGGNAIDAAAATVFAMSVGRPQSCGIGGGGFMLYRSRTGRVRSLDFRETAPAAMTPTSLSGEGLHKTFTGHLTVGVPGVVAGLDAALTRYGTITLSEAIAPAERLARNGVVVPPSMTAAIAQNAERLRLMGSAAGVFLPGGQPLAAGQRLVQPELAASLRRIMRGGRDAFYRGTIARRIVRDMGSPRPQTQDPGLLTLADFADYRAKWRTPLSDTYRDKTVYAVPPPTSGGVALLQMLSMLEPWELRTLGGPTSAQSIHLVAEAQKLAFADRAAYIADPEFVRQPTAWLLSEDYINSRLAQMDSQNAGTYPPGFGPPDTNPNGTTTHISIVDARGNAVALTCTIEQEFGSAVMAPGTGILLNNELTDFGAPGTANEPAGGKRPRSSMSPTIVEAGNQPVLVAGGAGGARIIMGVLHAVLRTAEFGESLARAVDAERWDNLGTNNLAIEDARIDPAVLADLESRGHRLVREGEYGPRPRVQLAGVDLETGERIAVSDSRSDQGSLSERGVATGRPRK